MIESWEHVEWHCWFDIWPPPKLWLKTWRHGSWSPVSVLQETPHGLMSPLRDKRTYQVLRDTEHDSKSIKNPSKKHVKYAYKLQYKNHSNIDSKKVSIPKDCRRTPGASKTQGCQMAGTAWGYLVWTTWCTGFQSPSVSGFAFGFGAHAAWLAASPFGIAARDLWGWSEGGNEWTWVVIR